MLLNGAFQLIVSPGPITQQEKMFPGSVELYPLLNPIVLQINLLIYFNNYLNNFLLKTLKFYFHYFSN